MGIWTYFGSAIGTGLKILDRKTGFRDKISNQLRRWTINVVKKGAEGMWCTHVPQIFFEGDGKVKMSLREDWL